VWQSRIPPPGTVIVREPEARMTTALRAKGGVLLLVIALALSPPASAGEDPAEDRQPPRPVAHGSLVVTGEAIRIPAVSTAEAEELQSVVPLGDGSEALRDLVGADLGRMGGHGLEPYVRGQSQGDLTVLVDGAVINGGCPNRMDPPTSYATVSTTDRVVVIRGVQSLQYGPGAPGGTVIYDRRAAVFDGSGWSVDAGIGGSTWAEAPDVDLDAALGLDDWSLRLLASYRDTGNYSDGNGDEVRSAAESAGGTVMVGWRPDTDTEIELSYERSTTRDALFAGAGMDSPESTADILRFQTARTAADGRLGWRLDAFYDTVDHLMDNYSLRELTAPMAMRVPTATSTWGLRGHVELGRRNPIQIGITVESAGFDATRYSGPDPDRISTVQSILWADLERSLAGVFVEGSAGLGAATDLVYGARVDHFTAESHRADEATLNGNGPTPRQLWSMYTSNDDASWAATDVGALVRIEHRLAGWMLFGGLSRSIRVADATERWIAANSAAAPMRWVGNPGLEPARHHQLDLGVGWSGSGSSAGLTLFAADVSDYILRDRAHGQEGVLRDDSATIYRNVHARRYGVEGDVLVRLSPAVAFAGRLSWVRAENTTDHRPIAQTPPLHGNVSLSWSPARWTAAATVRFAAEQTRVDDDPTTGSGLDAGPTPGWAVLDLTGAVDVGAGFTVRAGIANAFDRGYANHLNRASAFDPSAVRVNEPGRTFWLRVHWRISDT
jgi:iron complex outermembrane receptor protein